jgi:hypothetical protein
VGGLLFGKARRSRFARIRALSVGERQKSEWRIPTQAYTEACEIGGASLRNRVLLPVLFFLATGSLAAQASKPAPDAKQSENLPWDMSSHTGCLQNSLGKYMLVEEDGTSIELAGSAGKLKREVGHQVEVVGKDGVRTVDRTAPGGASNVAEFPVFEVKTVKQLATKCKTD